MIQKLVFLMIALVCLGSDTVRAQAKTTAVPFLLIAPDSRSSGMGETGVAIADNVWAIFWNPAGLAFQTGTEIAMTHTNWLPGLGLSDIWIGHLAGKLPLEEIDGVIAGQLTYLSLGEFTHTLNDATPLGTFSAYEIAFTAGYATKIFTSLGIGINARLIHSYLAPYGAAEEQGKGIATGFSFDVGLLYRPLVFVLPLINADIGRRISFGVDLSKIGPKLAYIDKAQADPLPMSLRFGFAFNVLQSEYNNMIFTAELNRLLVARWGSTSDEFYKAIYTTWTQGNISEQIRRFTSGLGMEYWYGSPKLLALRVGYFYEDPREGARKFMTFGAGIRYDIFGFDFGYISTFESQHPLGETLRLTLSMRIGGDE